MRRALALATWRQVSASSTREMAERHAAALGRGAMGSPRPSACSEKGVHTAPCEVAAEVGQTHDRMLGAVHAAGKGGHESDGNHDPHDLPGPEAPAAGTGGIHGARHGVPEQQEAGQHQHAAVEDEEHVAQHRVAGDVHVAQEAQKVPRRVVGCREDIGIDGLRLCRSRQQAGHAEPHKPQAEGRERAAEQNAGPPLPLQQAPPAPLSTRRSGTPGTGELPCTGERPAVPSESARTFARRRRAAFATSPRLRPISGAKRKRRSRTVIAGPRPDR